MSVRGRLLVALAVVVCAVAATAGVWRWHTARGPHLRDDTPVLDRAVADTVTAAGDDTAVAVTSLVRTRTCSLGVLRPGGVYSRRVEFYVNTGDEDRLISTIAQRLPASYHASRQSGIAGQAAPVTATAAARVTVSVRQLGDGWVVAAADTGCTAGPAPSADPTVAADTPDAVAVSDLFTALVTRPAALHRRSLPCPGGGPTTTIAAISVPTDSDRLAQRVAVPAGARAYLAASANRVAYRTGATSVVVAGSDDGSAITVRHTTSC